MRWFVYYDDGRWAGRWDAGDVGFRSFDTNEAALLFIEGRLRERVATSDINSYTLVEGSQRQIAVSQVVTKVHITR